MKRRSGDPHDFDAEPLRTPVDITISQHDLTAAFAAGRSRSALVSAAVASVVAIIAAVIIGLLGISQITKTVRKDVGRAAIANCERVNHIGPALVSLKAFLTSDARYAQALASLDDRQQRLYVQSGQVTRDIGVTLRQLGMSIPARLSNDYVAWAAIDGRQGAIFTKLERIRASAARLWAGSPNRQNGTSLADQITLISKVSCARILLP